VYLKEEDKVWIPHETGDRLNYILNGVDTVEYIVDISKTYANMPTRGLGSDKFCSTSYEEWRYSMKPSINHGFCYKEGLECLTYNISHSTPSFYNAYSVKSSTYPDSTVEINGITYSVYNFNYDTKKYKTIEKVVFSTELGYVYVRDSVGNYIRYLNKIP